MSRAISPAEVALHNSEKDCWIIVNGKVYDVTKYLNDHPGGVDIVTELAGKDSTEDYNDVGHTGDADAVLATLQIGVLSSSAPPPKSDVVAPPKPDVVAPNKKVVVAPETTRVPDQRVPTPKPQPQPESDNSMLILGGVAVAIATAAFFLLKKSKE
ncbi:hypothetical protein BASA81_013846 [Batrachochytrium salamandrivorans]|nr:hypothetical protein BASA81_013846 [Batrachochytrium salamandrivorans]